jgi:hypothetical protein
VKQGEEESWTPIYKALNLPLVKTFSEPRYWDLIDQLLVPDVYEPVGIPIPGEAWQAEQKIRP